MNGKVFKYSNIVIWQYPKLHEGLGEDLTFARHRVESPPETPRTAKHESDGCDIGCGCGQASKSRSRNCMRKVVAV